MKKLLLIFAILCSAILTKAQTNYLLPGGVAGVKMAFQSPFVLNMNRFDTSKVVTSETYWFKNNDAYGGGSTPWTVPVNTIFTNLTNNWVKISCYDFTKTTLLRTINAAPNNVVYWNHNDQNALISTSTYYWKFENIASQTPQLVADTKYCEAFSTVSIDVTGNDLNLPSGFTIRAKPLQTVTGLQILQTYGIGIDIKAGANPGIYTFKYEVLSGTTIIGEQTVTVNIASGVDYCTLNITDIKPSSSGNNLYDVTLSSPNAGINPFRWSVQKASDGTILKQGTTPPATSNKEQIDLSGIPTGTYRVIFESTKKTCMAFADVVHVLATERCDINIQSVDKTPGTNTYKVNVAFSGVTSYKYSSNLNSVFGTAQTGSSFVINLDGITSATYSIRVDGEGKTCNASSDIIHYLSDVPTGAERIETYVKLLANHKDNWIIAGTNSKGGTRDYDTQSRSAETLANITWQTYISDFNNPSNAANAHASIGLQKDTARNEPNISILVTPTKILLQRRSTKNGATATLQTIDNVTFPVWLRLRKIGNSVTAEYSKTASMSPVWTTIAVVQNATVGWPRTYYKTLGVGSTTPNYIAEARFRGQLGGQINFVTQTPNTPLIASVPTSPVAGNSVTFSATGCAGSINWFANNVGVGTGTSLNITNAVSGTVYAAKCSVNGKVSALSSTITIGENNGLLSCKNGSSFDIASVTPTTGTNYSVAFNAANLSSATVKIKNSAGVEQRSYTQSITANPVIINAGVLSSGTYTLDLVGLSCNGTASKTFTVVNNNPSCINGSTFDILSVTQGTGNNYSVQFNANNLSNLNVLVKNSSNVIVKDFDISIVANPVVLDLGNLSGTYTLVFNGISCQGQASKTFTATGTLSAPTIASSVNPAVVGANMTFTATNCTNTIDWYKNNNYVSSGTTYSITSAVLNDIYSAKCKEGTNVSVASNEIIIQAVGGNVGGGEGNVVSTFVNYLKQVPYETQNEKYSPHLFPDLTGKIAKSVDPAVGFEVFNWNVIWQVDGLQFKQNNRTYESVGMISPDFVPQANNGIGVRTVDYVMPFDPNTGVYWTADTYSNPPKVISDFVSAIPLRNRFYSTYGAGVPVVAQWNAYNNSQLYDQGVSAASSLLLGGGDKVSGLYNTAWASADIETAHEATEKMTPFLLGMYKTSRGFVNSQYSSIFNNAGYIVHNQYPDANGNYTGSPDINPAWFSSTKVTISDRGITNEGLFDKPRVVPGGETSSYAHSGFVHGTTYQKEAGGPYTTVNKFGTSANVEHTIARTIALQEIERWYVDNKMDGRRLVRSNKILFDRGFGLNGAIGETNPALFTQHFDRRYSMMIGLLTFIQKADWLIWDRNIEDRNIDGYNAAFATVNLVNQKKILGVNTKSAADLYPAMKADLWNTEISYNGTTWTKHTGEEIQQSPNNAIVRTAYTTDGYWIVVAVRPEKIEPKDFWVRKTINNVTQTVHITANDWETCNYNYRNTALSNIPDSDKDYYFNIFKTDVSVSESSSVNAPVINSNPSVPVVGSPITFTATGCSGTVKWWLSDANVATGTTYTISNPTENNTYFATCTANSITSSASNSISISSNTVPVIVFVGESNATPRNAAETAAAGDYGLRSNIQVWNSSSNQFEQMNVPTNTTIGQYAATSTGWGWEVELANLRANGTITKDIRIVQTAQGGALFGQYNTNFAQGYWPQLQSKLTNAKNAVIAEGKTPVFFVMYSNGLNNVSTSQGRALNDPGQFPNKTGADYWQAAILANSANIRNITGANTKFCYMKFWGDYGGYLNGVIDNVVNTNTSLNFSISTSDLGIQSDGLHIGASGTKTAASRMASALNYFN